MPSGWNHHTQLKVTSWPPSIPQHQFFVLNDNNPDCVGVLRSKLPAWHQNDRCSYFKEAHIFSWLYREVKPIFKVGKPIVRIIFVVDERKTSPIQMELLRGTFVSSDGNDRTSWTVAGQQVTGSEVTRTYELELGDPNIYTGLLQLTTWLSASYHVTYYPYQVIPQSLSKTRRFGQNSVW